MRPHSNSPVRRIKIKAIPLLVSFLIILVTLQEAYGEDGTSDSANAVASQVPINFDTLPTNVTLSPNQYQIASFSSYTGATISTAYDCYYGWGGSCPNGIIATSGSGYSYWPTSDLYVNFAMPVNGLTFRIIGSQAGGSNGVIDVYVNNSYYTSTGFSSGQGWPGQTLPPITVNLSGFQHVTAIRIRWVSNSDYWYNAYYPLYYDDFLFTPEFSANIINPRVNGGLDQTTQNALAGADIVLQSSTSNGGGTYSWSFTPSSLVTVTSGSPTSSSITIRSNDVGSIKAKLTYTLNGVSVSPSVNINLIVPTLSSFAAQMIDLDQINRGQLCGFLMTSGATYSLGCALPNPDMTWTLDKGIVFTASAQIPPGNYLTDPAQAGIKFKQYSSTFRKRILDVDNNGYYAYGQLQCSTKRTSETDVNSGWQTDGPEAYGHPYIRPVPRFSAGNTITYRTFDAPVQVLDDSTFIYTSLPHMVDAYYTDGWFEMYADYFVGADPNSPIFKRPLRLASDASHLYHRIVWHWGGQAYYDSAIPTTRFQLQFSTTTPQGSIAATGTNSVVPVQDGQANNNPWAICAGGSPPSNIRIDGTRYFVLQLYWDVLGRTADQGGWDGWTSVISRCAFDQNCISSRRILVARGFLESAENFANNPLLANPGTHEYNREYVRLCYQSFLGRGPDGAGWDGWTNYIDGNPGNYDILVGGFINSNEYRNRTFPDRDQ